MFAIQYFNRPGIGYGGYMVNDGSHLVFIPCTTANDTGKLFLWLGNGDMARGRDVHRDLSIELPAIFLNPKQYNDMVNDMYLHTVMPYTKEG